MNTIISVALAVIMITPFLVIESEMKDRLMETRR